ncbi:sigma-70 family RNA polymerase sigma factor [Streptomyces sp. RB6PN25]|uniref:Sigma-70 family RNA polymerase sigma factor n=1 Tax=Streptomyces humicola TaxID=2953240 RepID=A0ABT1Q4V7_9ACTN|nr:sigma-70 family RNA polymerase sigma factor [Streptomyces humicola]MCQ4084958.1 sigma-70 family RNA polymerase sigma factor [Streptomyces humicola]
MGVDDGRNDSRKQRIPGQATGPAAETESDTVPETAADVAAQPAAAPGPSGHEAARQSAGENVPPQREHPGNADTAQPDADLVARVRGGDDSAYEELYRRHADAVRRYARTCCRDAHTAEDLTGEVFARTLHAVRGGSGPDSAVRAYLLTTVRRVAASWANTAKREQLVEDFAVFAVSATGSTANEDTLDLGADVRAMHQAEQSLAIKAFRTLPERWQAVLWHTAVEEESPSQIAPLLGLTANATAVLAHRAREGLRQAYLQAHVNVALTTSKSECAQYADRLGAHARGSLRLRADRELRGHLQECSKCRAAAVELADVNACLKGLLPVATVGWFAAAYAAKVAGVAAAGAAGAAGAGAAAAAASGSGSGSAVGGAAGAAASEGASLPAKIGIAAGVVVAAAGVALAATLLGNHSPAPKPQAKPPAAPRPIVQVSNPAPRPRPTPTPTAAPTAPAAAPTHAPPPPTPSAAPTPSRKPTPAPTPTAPPPATVYRVNQLQWSVLSNGNAPTVDETQSSWMWQRNGMTIDGRSYAAGVTVGAPSSVLIDLNRTCTSYDAMAGVDDMAMGLGTVRFLVYGDGTLLYESGAVQSGDPAVPVHAGLTGHRTLRLVVEPTDPLQLANVADWADSRITCQ